MTTRLAGKIAVVTGASSGIGQATAIEFAAQGARVLCVGRDEAAIANTVTQVRAAGGVGSGTRADLTEPEDAERMTRVALEEHGRIDVVFAGAGSSGGGTAAETSPEDWARVIAVNLTAKWLSFKYALPAMVERGTGSVIVVSSIGAYAGVPRSFPYAAAKGGCVSMVRQAAVDYAPEGVRVNGIAPGTVPTPLVRRAYESGGGFAAGTGVEEGFKRAAAKVPLGRLGTAEEIAHLGVYLASDESAWTTGQTFVVDGGLTAQ